MTYKLAIIDDEEDARALVQFHLKRHPAVQVIGEAGDGAQALQLIEREKPDLVLLDIQMPEMSGLEVVMQANHQSLIIFITAYDEFAIQAFELNAVDYLLKPFAAERFDEALHRAQARIQAGQPDSNTYQTLLEELIDRKKGDVSYIKRIAYKVDSKTHYILTDSIQCIEAAEQYVNIHTPEKKYLVRQSMDYLEERLDPDQFFRTHRSYIVHLNQVEALEQFGPRAIYIHLKNGMKVKLSQVRKQLFQNKLNLG